jgi:hypothetical protein
MKFSKSTTETLEKLHESFGEYSLSWTAVLNGSHVSGPVECQSRMADVQGDQTPGN